MTDTADIESDHTNVGVLLWPFEEATLFPTMVHANDEIERIKDRINHRKLGRIEFKVHPHGSKSGFVVWGSLVGESRNLGFL